MGYSATADLSFRMMKRHSAPPRTSRRLHYTIRFAVSAPETLAAPKPWRFVSQEPFVSGAATSRIQETISPDALARPDTKRLFPPVSSRGYRMPHDERREGGKQLERKEKPTT